MATKLLLSVALLLSSCQGAAIDTKAGKPWKVLPVGASIVAGVGSPSRNGFRQFLKDDLVPQEIDYIGTRQSGTMVDKQHEGYPGLVISQVAAKIDGALKQSPDVVLIHVGTNDFNTKKPIEPVEEAPERFGKLIDKIITASPNAVVLASQLIASKKKTTQDKIDAFNEKIPGIVEERANAGKRVLVVDMREVTTKYLNDTIHPNDEGFKIMARKWKEGIAKAQALNWL